MLHNVPVARILGFLFLASVVILGLITYDGYRSSSGSLNVSTHIRFALYGIVIVLFTHTMSLFYFVGTGSRIKKVVKEYALPQELVDRTRRIKARLFPWLTFTPLVTMAAFIIGGGAHTHAIPAWVHGVLALLALGMNLTTAVLAVVCISDNVVLIEEIDGALPESAGERP
jgi:ABC-type transport system involved in cytochrome c biogenesis permease subunit